MAAQGNIISTPELENSKNLRSITNNLDPPNIIFNPLHMHTNRNKNNIISQNNSKNSPNNKKLGQT